MHSMKGECLRISAFHTQIKKCTMKRMARQYLLSEGLCYLKKVFGCCAAKDTNLPRLLGVDNYWEGILWREQTYPLPFAGVFKSMILRTFQGGIC